MRIDHHLTEGQIKGAVFFTTRKIELYKPELTNGKERGRVIIPKGTPAIVERVGPDRLALRFEPGSNKYLMFGAKRPLGSYVLLAENWTDGHGEVEYGGETYFISPGGGKAAIAVYLEHLISTEKEEVRKLKGLTY